MVTTDFIYFFWEKEQKIIKKNLEILKKQQGKKPAHDIRVAVKKLRAALNLFYLLTDMRESEDLLKNTNQLYSVIGKQRDLDICIEIIETAEKETGNKYPDLKKFIRSLLSDARKWTRLEVKKYKRIELEETATFLKDNIKNFEPEDLKYKIKVIIVARLNYCRSLYKIPHKLRQNLKELYYWIKMIPESIFPPFTSEKELVQLLDDFGNWQNLTVIEIKLKHYRKDYLPKTFPEYYLIKMLEVMVKEKMEVLLKASIYNTKILLRKARSLEKEIP